MPEVTPHGTTNHMAFHHVAQIQLSVACDVWSFNFFVDNLAWLEQANLVAKITQPAQHRECEALLQDVIDHGYDLRIWSANEDGVNPEPRSAPAEFLSDLARYRQAGLSVNVDIYKLFDPQAPENDEDTLPARAMQEFTTLLPLYRFWSWHPTENHHIREL